jgi:hypothetical protein
MLRPSDMSVRVIVRRLEAWELCSAGLPITTAE